MHGEGELGLFGLEWQSLVGIPIAAGSCLMGGCGEDDAGLFSEVQGDGTSGNGHTVEHGGLHLGMRGRRTPVRRVTYWGGPGGAVGSPSLEVLEGQLEEDLSNLFELNLLGAGGRSLPACLLLW